VLNVVCTHIYIYIYASHMCGMANNRKEENRKHGRNNLTGDNVTALLIETTGERGNRAFGIAVGKMAL